MKIKLSMALFFMATCCLNDNVIKADSNNFIVKPNKPKVTKLVLSPIPTINISKELVLRGDNSCKWGASDCNTCVTNVPLHFSRLQTSYKEAGRIRFDGYAHPTEDKLLNRIDGGEFLGNYEHVQGIGRIAGIGNNEYMVFTHSTASDESNKQGAIAVVRMGANQFSRGFALAGDPESVMASGDDKDQNKGNRTVARTFTKNNHPGGLFVMGHYVYVAQWCQEKWRGGQMNGWCSESSEANYGMGFSVYDVRNVHKNSTINSSPPVDRSYRHVYNEPWINTSSTASIGATKLVNGQYLVALGQSGGSEYGFYISPSPVGPFAFLNEVDFRHRGENTAIVSDCNTGELYMFQIEGWGDDSKEDKVHLYYLSLNRGKINAEYMYSRHFTCRGDDQDGAGDWCHFDAGGGVFITPQGTLLLYGTDWHQSDSGNIRLVEFKEVIQEKWTEH